MDNQQQPCIEKQKKKSVAQPRPQILVKARGIGPVMIPNENDVLSGRGGRINAHVGNVQFRRFVYAKRVVYLDKNTKKLEKAHIAALLVYSIRSMEPPGRFLKQDNDGKWWDIGDQRAIKKVGQAMREFIRVPDPTFPLTSSPVSDTPRYSSTGDPSSPSPCQVPSAAIPTRKQFMGGSDMPVPRLEPGRAETDLIKYYRRKEEEEQAYIPMSHPLAAAEALLDVARGCPLRPPTERTVKDMIFDRTFAHASDRSMQQAGAAGPPNPERKVPDMIFDRVFTHPSDRSMQQAGAVGPPNFFYSRPDPEAVENSGPAEGPSMICDRDFTHARSMQQVVGPPNHFYSRPDPESVENPAAEPASLPHEDENDEISIARHLLDHYRLQNAP